MDWSTLNRRKGEIGWAALTVAVLLGGLTLSCFLLLHLPG